MPKHLIMGEVFRVGDKPNMYLAGIPWDMISPHKEQAAINHGKSLAAIQEDGGLSWNQTLAVLTGERWSNVPDAQQRVEAMVDAWERSA